MKKIIAMFAALLLVIVPLSACGGNSNSSFKDGKYTAEEATRDDNGWLGFVEVEVLDGKISELKLDYKNVDGKLKSEDAEYNESYKAASGISTIEGVTQLSDQYKLNPKSEELKKVTGATSSTDLLKTLMSDLEINMQDGNTDKIVVDTSKK
ncbi:MAG: hypothetical protein ACRCZK_04210 [Oscillospiraceae bacterium]